MSDIEKSDADISKAGDTRALTPTAPVYPSQAPADEQGTSDADSFRKQPPGEDRHNGHGRARRGGILGLIIGVFVLGFLGGLVGSSSNVRDFFNIGNGNGGSSHIAVAKTPGGGGEIAAKGTMTPHQIYEQVSPAVVHITAIRTVQTSSIFGFGQLQQGEVTGSGFVIDHDGHIVTNAHVVEGVNKATVSFSDNKSYPAKIVGRDVSSDLAVLQVNANDASLKDGLEPVTFGDSSKVKVGDPVVAIGNPFNLDRTLTSGVVSALQRQIQATNGFTIDNILQTDAAINPGNSGGPLINAFGQVIGVNSQIATQSGGNEGIGFSIPSNTVRHVANELIKNGSVSHAFLGVVGSDLTSSITDNFKEPVKHGVLVASVQKGSPAAKAGMKGGSTNVTIDGDSYVLGGSVLTKFDGHKVTGIQQLVQLVDNHQAGDKVDVEFYNGSKKVSATVKLAKRPAAADNSDSSDFGDGGQGGDGQGSDGQGGGFGDGGQGGGSLGGNGFGG